MNIRILSVGKLKERYWKEALSEYEKRLGRYCKLEVMEVEDEAAPEQASPREEEQIKTREGERLLSKIPKEAHVIALEIRGREQDSETMARQIAELGIKGKSHLCFVIGGSLGLSRAVLDRADEKWSFSRLTFPHQMMRVILLEQLYRSFRIIRGEPYHK
ncbi:MAG: 23S rRNA (pseudouridine(1915)-N(3))-methyltransferase RlmH [Lachnospiraceae bacterium]|nr:23S rRNA (pseudouridine(1915)-N(3))-methyltransferase RlmH [Lachnospiraceae bacterium]